MPVWVQEATSLPDRRQFIELPFRLHSTSAQWVPPLRAERHLFLNRRVNAFFKRGEAQEFLARRPVPGGRPGRGRVVGRITAQIDRAYDAQHGGGTGMFGFAELEDDPEVATALLDAARGWLARRGRTRMIGPMDFTMNDECGVLIEGFDREPMIKQPWHPSYYQARLEEAGLRKAIDLWMWELEIADRERIVPAIFELAERASSQHGIRLRKMSRRRLRSDLDAFAEIYNTAWKDNWGFVPFSKADLDHYAQELQLVYDRDWFMVAEKDGRQVGVAITVPDLNQVLRRMNGRLLPLGWWRFLRKGSMMDRVRVGFLGVKPEFQHTGVAAQLYVEHFDVAVRRPQKWGEMGWILETNRAMNRGMEAMGGRIAKRYRIYETDV